MRTVRRLYFYLLALIGSQALVWGVIHLLRTLVDEGLTGSVSSLATGLALAMVGLPVFLLHWLTAQRDAARDEEEGASRIRAVFFYAARAWTLLPVVFSAMAVLNRALAGFMNLAEAGVLFGSDQTVSDNLISIAVNLLAFAYFDTRLRSDWRTAPPDHFLAEARRLYRYLWTLFGLTVTIFGVQGMLRYLLTVQDKLGAASGYLLANSLAMALVNAPVWSLTWRLVQKSRAEAVERTSLLRLVVLYLINLAGVVGVLASGGQVLTSLFAVLLGSRQTFSQWMFEITPALSVLVPLAVVWAYHWRILDEEMLAIARQPRRAGVRRLYYALLSALGLAVVFTGVATLITYLTSSIFNWSSLTPGWGQLNSGLAALAIGLPLWLTSWAPLKNEAMEAGEAGNRARRALTRRAYLYLAVFAFVVGLMVATGDLLYNLVSHLLGSPIQGIGSLATARLLTLMALVVFLVYHQRILQQDGRAAQEALGNLHAAFPVLLLVREEEMPLAEEILRALKKQAPRLPATVYNLSGGSLDDRTILTKLIVMLSGLAFDPPGGFQGWLKAYQGPRLIIPQNLSGWYWLGFHPRPLSEVAEETSTSIRQMAEGDAPRGGLPPNPWSAAGYILGGVFSLVILFALFGLLASSLFQ
ncbi:MAG: hypothetical protein HPY59_17045 [Anaerolineae bacterium]|nr:hypothetical protein [Anaerolineae bacterium]